METATHEANPVTVTVTQDDAVNWLIRSVIPHLLDVIEFEDDAAWFEALPPYSGFTSSGRLRGWAGSVKRLQRAQDAFDEAYSKLLGIYNGPISTPATPAEESVRAICTLARQTLYPSRLGFHAYRIVWTVLELSDRGIEAMETDPAARDALCRERDEAWRELLDLLLANGDAPSEGETITSPGAVTPDQFATVLAAHKEADDMLTDAYAAYHGARDALAPHTCTEEVLIVPSDGETHGDFTEPCGRPRSHSGPCAEEPTGDDVATPGPYRDLHAVMTDTEEKLAAANRRFVDANDALEALQCGEAAPDGWGCVLRRGHEGAHHEPDELRLIL